MLSLNIEYSLSTSDPYSAELIANSDEETKKSKPSSLKPKKIYEQWHST